MDATKKLNPTVRITKGAADAWEPELLAHKPMDMDCRMLNAQLYTMAAQLELALHPDERWVVRVEPYTVLTCDPYVATGGRIFVTVAENTFVEAERALDFLWRHTVGWTRA
jgi:hypothetical protein